MNKFKVFIRVVKYPSCFFRIRIIYPDGTAEYSTDWKFDDFDIPCWYWTGMTEKESIKAMKAYDKRLGYKTKLLFKF